MILTIPFAFETTTVHNKPNKIFAIWQCKNDLKYIKTISTYLPENAIYKQSLHVCSQPLRATVNFWPYRLNMHFVDMHFVLGHGLYQLHNTPGNKKRIKIYRPYYTLAGVCMGPSFASHILQNWYTNAWTHSNKLSIIFHALHFPDRILPYLQISVKIIPEGQIDK